MPFNFDFLQHFPSQIRVSGVYKGFDYYLIFFIHKYTWARNAKKCRMIEQNSVAEETIFPTTIRHHSLQSVGKGFLFFRFSESEKSDAASTPRINSVCWFVCAKRQCGDLCRCYCNIAQHCTTCRASIQRQSDSLQRRTSNGFIFFARMWLAWTFLIANAMTRTHSTALLWNVSLSFRHKHKTCRKNKAQVHFPDEISRKCCSLQSNESSDNVDLFRSVTISMHFLFTSIKIKN